MIADDTPRRQSSPRGHPAQNPIPPHPGPEPWLPAGTPTIGEQERWCSWCERRERYLMALLEQEQQQEVAP